MPECLRNVNTRLCFHLDRGLARASRCQVTRGGGKAHRGVTHPTARHKHTRTPYNERENRLKKKTKNKKKQKRKKKIHLFEQLPEKLGKFRVPVDGRLPTNTIPAEVEVTAAEVEVAGRRKAEAAAEVPTVCCCWRDCCRPSIPSNPNPIRSSRNRSPTRKLPSSYRLSIIRRWRQSCWWQSSIRRRPTNPALKISCVLLHLLSTTPDKRIITTFFLDTLMDWLFFFYFFSPLRSSGFSVRLLKKKNKEKGKC